MPFINIKANVPISKEKEVNIKSRFGEIITDIGKTESWLMVGIEGDSSLYFKGSDEPCAIAEVSLYGKASPSAYNSLTGHITDTLTNELSIQSSRIYVKYNEVEYWGLNGNNF